MCRTNMFPRPVVTAGYKGGRDVIKVFVRFLRCMKSQYLKNRELSATVYVYFFINFRPSEGFTAVSPSSKIWKK